MNIKDMYCKPIVSKLRLLFGLLLLSVAFHVAAQCPSSLYLDKQSQVDRFPTDYPNCVHMNTSLTIVGSEITNLDAFQQVKSNKKFISLQASSLQDISGLSNLQQLDSDFFIHKTGLKNLQGLENLRTVKGQLSIADNPLMTTLTHFDSLKEVQLRLYGNPVMADLGTFPVLENVKWMSISNLPALDSIGAAFPVLSSTPYLTITNNPNLLHLRGLHTLEKAGSLAIANNEKLLNLNGLESLRQVTLQYAIEGNAQLLDLTGLSEMDSIGELRLIKNPALGSLRGLENVKAIGEMTIEENPALQILADSAALPAKVSILSIRKNKSLKNLGGLEKVTQLDDLEIENNDSLQTLHGLHHLSGRLNKNLSIQFNPQLEDLAALQNVEEVGVILQIEANDLLQDLSGLDHLQRVEYHLAITRNKALKNLHGLEQLSHLPTIYVHQNDSLQSINALISVMGSAKSYVSIKENPVLDGCEAIGICNMLALGYGYFIADNAPGCSTYDDIRDNCTFSFQLVKGRVFADPQCKNIPAASAIPLPNWILRDVDGQPFATTDAKGEYLRFLAKNQTYTYRADTLPGYQVVPENQVVNATDSTQVFLNRHIFLCPDGQFSNLRVSLATTEAPRPGFEQRYFIEAENRGSAGADAKLVLEFEDPAIADYLVVQDAGGAIETSPKRLEWTLNFLPIFTPKQYEVVIRLLPDAPTGQMLLPRARIVSLIPNVADIDPSDNEAAFPQTIVSSFDPNDKTVDQPQINLKIDPDDHLLTYTVRFQNTGTAAATFIEIRDTLPTDLDIRTLRLGPASHLYRLDFPAGNVLKFRFDDINLPDSTTNEPASHGFVQFSVKAKPLVSPGDSIRNRVGIYFDFNPVVLTNFAKTAFYLPVSTSTTVENLGFQVSPNPVSEEEILNIILESDFSGNVKIEILSLEGRLLKVFEKEKTARVLNIGSVLNPSDIRGNSAFFVRVSDGKTSATRLVVKL